MFKKYQLTDIFWLEICAFNDTGALNGYDFEAKREWVIGEDLDEKINYYTKASKKFNLPKSENPKLAVQQLLLYAMTGKTTKLKEIYFKIIRDTW